MNKKWVSHKALKHDNIMADPKYENRDKARFLKHIICFPFPFNLVLQYITTGKYWFEWKYYVFL